jgi:hypothetical protein
MLLAQESSRVRAINVVARLIRSLGEAPHLREELSHLRRNGAASRSEHNGTISLIE